MKIRTATSMIILATAIIYADMASAQEAVMMKAIQEIPETARTLSKLAAGARKIVPKAKGAGEAAAKTGGYGAGAVGVGATGYEINGAYRAKSQTEEEE